MSRVAFLVYVDLDDRPGPMHSKESAQHSIRNALVEKLANHNPLVSLAPNNLQNSSLDKCGIRVFEQAYLPCVLEKGHQIKHTSIAG